MSSLTEESVIMENNTEEELKLKKGRQKLPLKQILNSSDGRKWKVGPLISEGGFGKIYSAQECVPERSRNFFRYAIKVEPYESKALLAESYCYTHCGDAQEIEAFKTRKNINFLGMPKMLATGVHEYRNQKFRFLVMEKFGTDFFDLINKKGTPIPAATAFQVAIQILHVLEFMHSKGLTHGDVKTANILLGLGKEPYKEVYLVDFGLCDKYISFFKPDSRKAHKGTIDFMSRDGHCGVQSRRGDLESLGYTILRMLGCDLPWEKCINDEKLVKQKKEKCMEDIPGLFTSCFGTNEAYPAVYKFFENIVALQFEVTPDYDELNRILEKGVISEGKTMESNFEF